MSSVLSHRSKNLKRQTDQCYSSLLQLSFIWQAKDNTSLRHEGGLNQKTWKEERDSILVPFYLFFLLPLSLPYVN